VAKTLPLDTDGEAYLSLLYEDIITMTATDLIYLTWGGKVVARIIVGG